MVAPEVKQNTDDTEITKTCAVSGCEDYKNLEPDSFFRWFCIEFREGTVKFIW